MLKIAILIVSLVLVSGQQSLDDLIHSVFTQQPNVVPTSPPTHPPPVIQPNPNPNLNPNPNPNPIPGPDPKPVPALNVR